MAFRRGQDGVEKQGRKGALWWRWIKISQEFRASSPEDQAGSSGNNGQLLLRADC